MSELDKLEAVRAKATPGPWRVGYSDKSGWYSHDDGEFALVDGDDQCILHAKMCESGADASYIATFNPTLMKALIAELKAARSVLDTIKHIEVKGGFEAGLVWPEYSPTLKHEYSLTKAYDTARAATDKILTGEES